MKQTFPLLSPPESLDPILDMAPREFDSRDGPQILAASFVPTPQIDTPVCESCRVGLALSLSLSLFLSSLCQIGGYHF